MRIGFGYDVHRLASGRRLVLGGLSIPFEKGLQGHSDADVLVHAICDALLGAAGLGDIGEHFPDTDPAFKDVSSMLLLRRTHALLQAEAFRIVNIDATVIAEQPRIGPYREEMRRRIAEVLDLPPGRVNVKATTTEGLDSFGRGEAVGAMCAALIESLPSCMPCG